MKNILNELTLRHQNGRKSIAVLIDPDKTEKLEDLIKLIDIANENYVDFFFVGGSLITNDMFSTVIKTIKCNSSIPVIIFPGSNIQIDNNADGILLLSLISGRNPEFIIGQHVTAAHRLKSSGIEIIPTSYILIDGGSSTSVVYMSHTLPIPSTKNGIAANTALAGELLGHKLTYLDAGSGAKNTVNLNMIEAVRKEIINPLIVGGGINTPNKAIEALNAGADLIVIGNAAEKNPNLLIEVSNVIYDYNKSLNIH